MNNGQNRQYFNEEKTTDAMTIGRQFGNGATKIWTKTARINYLTIMMFYDGDLGTTSTKNMEQDNDEKLLTTTKIWG
uniref:Uncharacterized protein n=1 Tax=Romanomermis culicivorax TaxID=13658 RepID=A0A915HQT5_ROMCU